MAIAFLASRTVGLPGFHEAWTSDGGLGLLALPPEAVFVAIAFQSRLALRAERLAREGRLPSYSGHRAHQHVR
jgi:hypothetical protein